MDTPQQPLEKAKGRKSGHAAHRAHRKARCERYRASGQREVNKALKLMRHIRRYGVADECANSAFSRIPRSIKDIAERRLQRAQNIGAS